MNNIIKNDIDEILKKYKRAKNGKEMIKIANDFSNLLDAADFFKCNLNIKKNFPTDFLLLFKTLDNSLQKERDNITNQIYANLDKLEELYSTFINEFEKYGYHFKRNNVIKDIDLDRYHEFFSHYGNMEQEFNKVLNNNHLFIVDGETIGATINFKTLKKQYIFLSLDDFNYASRALAHEMGHVHAFNITYNDDIDDFNFLTEYMSFLMELNYINYENSEIDYSEKENVIYIMYLIMLQSLAQVKLMKKYPDAFISFKINSKYEKELDKLCISNYKHHRDSLYSQIYSIDYLLAINFYYQLKYGVDFNEIEKFYIENTCKNDLSSLLNYIDMDAIKQYLNELFINKQYKKR